MSRIETRFELSAEHLDDASRATCELPNETMVGLTLAETREFMALDARNQIDERGNPFQWPWDTTVLRKRAGWRCSRSTKRRCSVSSGLTGHGGIPNKVSDAA